MSGRPPRIGIVGVVRRRQGLGEWMGRWLVAAGAEVPAFIGSRPDTLGEGRAVLRRRGIDAEGFTTLDELLERHPLDGLVVASPAVTHARYLDAALLAGLPVLCEKPLTWGSGRGAADVAARVGAFAAAGLPLWECAQWPCTLPAFRALHPGAAGVPVRHIDMHLSPTGRGRSMLIDSMSHPLSLVQALTEPTGRIEGLAFSTVDADAGTLATSFRVPTVGGGTVVVVRLASHPRQPRPAGYVVNGLPAERRVRATDYTLTFEHGARSVPVEDPLGTLVAAFVEVVGGSAGSGDAGGGGPAWVRGDAITWRMQALADVVAGFDGIVQR